MGAESLLLAEHIGARIRFYRSRQNLSQEQLAAMIYKSKSTLSKYESGQIAMDVDTLYQIACALQVEMSQLVDFAIPTRELETPPSRNPFHTADTMYMYYYDGRSNRITRTYLRLDQAHRSGNTLPCLCYMDVPSFREHESCKYFYGGSVVQHEMVSYILLNNQFNPTEQITISVLNPFQPTQSIRGIMLALSFNPITPFAVKCLLSTVELPEVLLQKDNLMFSKDEIKEFKRLNMLLLNTEQA